MHTNGPKTQLLDEASVLGPSGGILDPVEAVIRVLASRYGPRMQIALLLALEGAGYRLAARLAGLKVTRAADVRRAAVGLGINQLHLHWAEERRGIVYSERDYTALSAVLGGQATTAQAIRAAKASMKRLEFSDPSFRAYRAEQRLRAETSPPPEGIPR